MVYSSKHYLKDETFLHQTVLILCEQKTRTMEALLGPHYLEVTAITKKLKAVIFKEVFS